MLTCIALDVNLDVRTTSRGSRRFSKPASISFHARLPRHRNAQKLLAFLVAHWDEEAPRCLSVGGWLCKIRECVHQYPSATGKE